MKVNQKYIEFGLIVVMALVIYLAYSFGYKNYIEKAQQTDNETATIRAEVEDLKEKASHKSEWEKGISQVDELIETVLEKYGPDNPTEKAIMTVVELERLTGCFVKTVAFSDYALEYESEVEGSDEAESAEGEETSAAVPEIRVYRQTMALTLDAGYTQMKKIFDYINGCDERMTIEDFSISYDVESGKLSCTFAINLYTVLDKNHEYVPIVVDDVEIGNENIFRSTYVNPLDLLLDSLEQLDSAIDDLTDAIASEGTEDGELAGEGA